MSKLEVGQEYVDYTGDVCLTIVFKDGVWASESERLDFLEDMGEDNCYSDSTIIAYESEQYCEYRDDPAECIDEFNYILKSAYEKNQEERQRIVQLLKDNKVDTADLIVSDGRVFIGYSECANYIQASHAWCSSSMSC